MNVCSETIQAKTEYSELFEVLRENKTYLFRILYTTKLSFKSKRGKTFSDKQKLREFVASRPALQEMLKKFFGEKENNTGQTLGSVHRKEEHQRRNK